jgi:hypothetical protein
MKPWDLYRFAESEANFLYLFIYHSTPINQRESSLEFFYIILFHLDATSMLPQQTSISSMNGGNVDFCIHFS